MILSTTPQINGGFHMTPDECTKRVNTCRICPQCIASSGKINRGKYYCSKTGTNIFDIKTCDKFKNMSKPNSRLIEVSTNGK